MTILNMSNKKVTIRKIIFLYDIYGYQKIIHFKNLPYAFRMTNNFTKWIHKAFYETILSKCSLNLKIRIEACVN